MLAVLFSSTVNCSIAEETNKSSNFGDAEYYYNQGTNYVGNGAWEKAINAFSEAVDQLDPTNALAYTYRGASYFAKGDWDNAISDLSQQIQLDPTNTVAYQNRANVYRAKGEFDHAILDLNKCLQLDPTNFTAYASRASIYNRRQEFEKAVRDLNQAMQINPDDARILVMRAYAYSHEKQYVKAKEDLRQAILLDPKNCDAYNDLGWLCATCPVAGMRDGKKAVETATKACELTNWEQWKYVDTLAAAFAEAGNFKKAVECEKQAAGMNQINEDDRMAIQRRLLLYEQQKPDHETYDQ